MEINENKQRMIIISLIVIMVILFSAFAYLFNKNKTQEIADESLKEDFGYESASTQIGKTVEEVKNEVELPKIEKNNIENTNSIKENIIKEEKITSKQEKKNVEIIAKEPDKKETNERKENVEVVEEKKSVEFEAPIKGEIIREFAVDALVYSDTLKEWVIHNGIDIKADKTSVVSSAEAGTVYAIKNDPRYGLTVIINHDDGYQTIYSNLLTAEFVVQGESVEKGQSIGTVGNSAAFEVADDYHLHFELLQNNQYLDPSIFMEFK